MGLFLLEAPNRITNQLTTLINNLYCWYFPPLIILKRVVMAIMLLQLNLPEYFITIKAKRLQLFYMYRALP